MQWSTTRKWEAKDKDQQIRAFFGAPSKVIADVCNRIWITFTEEEQTKIDCCHILYAFVFLKVYSSEEILATLVGWPTKKTFQQWSWFFIEKISNLRETIILMGLNKW